MDNALTILKVLKMHAEFVNMYPGDEDHPEIHIVLTDENDEHYEIIRKWLEGE